MPNRGMGGSRARLMAGAGAIVLLAVGIVVALTVRGDDSSRSCAPAASGASPCGLWWGAALPANASKLPGAVDALQASTGRRLDIVHTYHRWFDSFPTASERALSKSGHLLLLNWEPVNSTGAAIPWSSIADGHQDAAIAAEAKRLAALPGPVLVSFSHEPENHYGVHGRAAEFVAAFRHVHDQVRADGATNVRWVWDVMGLSDPVWRGRYASLYPGNAYVDWVAWDPYNWGSCRHAAWRSFAGTVEPFYNWLESHGLGDKPFMLAEYGSVEQVGNPHGKADWLAGIPSALAAMPNLRALVYFDLPAPPANCNWQISTSGPATAAFAGLATSAPFRATAHSRPA
jgi:hypothetical protein